MGVVTFQRRTAKGSLYASEVRLHSSLYAFRVEEAAAGQHWDTAFQSWAIEALAGAPCILSLAQPPLLVLLQGGDPATEELTAHALDSL